MTIRHLLIALTWVPLSALAAGIPEYSSEIPGVQLLIFSTNDKGRTEAIIENPENEFTQYCKGSSRFVYTSLKKSPIRCRTAATDGPNVRRIYLETKPKAKFNGTPFIVSMKPLRPRVKPLTMTASERNALKRSEQPLAITLANEAKKTYLESYPDSDAAFYNKILKEIKASEAYKKYSHAKYKIPSPTGVIYISSIEIFPDAMGWDIKNIVFREINGRLKEVGSFSGCIKGFRDLDADGTPEVFSSLCEGGEGDEHDFWSLTPTIRSVVHVSW